MATLQSRVHIPENVLFHDLGGESVLLNLDSGKYYGLDPVGTQMWNLLAERGQVEPVYQAMLDEYEVSEDKLQTDLLELVERLAEQGLLIIVDPQIAHEA
jgi:hypothetical protein